MCTLTVFTESGCYAEIIAVDLPAILGIFLSLVEATATETSSSLKEAD